MLNRFINLWILIPVIDRAAIHFIIKVIGFKIVRKREILVTLLVISNKNSRILFYAMILYLFYDR